ncbi:MAG TPA: carboxypeptidase-like regulatory domain-containing protein [Vicinamibacterales bacterium]|nr:carboxypeptidase-like regulatory domain-containing protein [Vicinamibacterales bacterium]
MDVALTRARAITVRVVDEWGGPLAGLSVEMKRAESGRIAAREMGRSTDDKGRLRIYGLAPGPYVVCAQQEMIGISGSGRRSERERFVRTCYPSAASEAEAEAVVLENADIENLPIVMRRGRTFRISGTVVDSTGAPVPAASVGLEMKYAGGSMGSYRTAGSDGTFSIENLAPGNYTLTAEIGGPNRPEHRRELEAAYYPLSLEPDSEDLDGIVLRLVRTVTVRGRILLDDPAAAFPRPPGSGLFIAARLAAGASTDLGGSPAHVGEDRTFTLEGITASRTLDVYNVPRGWYVKSIRYENREIFGVPTEFRDGGDRVALEVVLSNRGATVAGRVTDDRGNPARGGRVLMFPAGKARWGYHESSDVPISRGGTFRLGPQRAGDYFIVALASGGAEFNPLDQSRWARLVDIAERITLAREEERVLDLRVVKPR